MTMIEKRKDFLINCAYLLVNVVIVFLIFKFTTNYLMPFVIGFLIAFLLKPIVRKLNEWFGQNKLLSILVIVLFYILVAALIIFLVFKSVSLVQSFIPRIDGFYNHTLLPMVMNISEWIEETTQKLNPELVEYIEVALKQFTDSLGLIVETVSKVALGWVTLVVSSAPSLLISIMISVISSFFFTLDYQPIVNTVLNTMPPKARMLVLEVKSNFGSIIGKYLKAYSLLISLTFVELTIGFWILRLGNPIGRAALIAVIDILPVLGTGTILIPWALYELILGEAFIGIGILVMYAIITVIRNILEPRIIGKQIGLHPLATLVSIFVGVKLLGFWGLFLFPIAVTIIKTLHDEGKVDIVRFFRNEEAIVEKSEA